MSKKSHDTPSDAGKGGVGVMDMNAPLDETVKMAARPLSVLCVLGVLWLGLPFATGAPLALEEANSWLMAGTLLAAGLSFGYAVAETTLRDAVLFFALGFLIPWAIEAGGVRWGFPFGWPYQYHDSLRPRLWGDVPLFIPLAWYALLRVPTVLLRNWKTWRDASKTQRDGRQVLSKAGACGLFMGGCSLLLEPLGVAIGAWEWSQPGIYFGLPVLNLFGWALVGFLVHAAYFALAEGHADGQPRWLQRLECEVLGMCLLFHALAFVAIYNRLLSWLPIIISAIAMAPLWVFWGLTTFRRESDEPHAEKHL